MSPDIQILSLVQIALIGILVLLGMYFMWRKIQRLESKVERWIGQMEHCMPVGDLCPTNTLSGARSNAVAADADAAAAAFFSPKMAPSSSGGTGGLNSPPPVVAEEDPDFLEETDDEDEDEADLFGLNPEEEALVQRILEGGGSPETAFMVFTPFGFTGTATATPTAIPVGSGSGPQVEIMEETPSETESHSQSLTPSQASGRMTKTKLSKMNVEQLKAYLSTQGVSTEGTKKQLLERAFETITLSAS